MLVQQGKPLRIVIADGAILGIEALGEFLRWHHDDASLSPELVGADGRLLPGLRRHWMWICVTSVRRFR